jgi:hypothetical protein
VTSLKRLAIFSCSGKGLAPGMISSDDEFALTCDKLWRFCGEALFYFENVLI